MAFLRKLFESKGLSNDVAGDEGGTLAEAIANKMPPPDKKNPEDYPPQFESLVEDYNQLNEAYNSACRLIETLETAMMEINRTNDLLMSMNSNLSTALRQMTDNGPVPSDEN